MDISGRYFNEIRAFLSSLVELFTFNYETESYKLDLIKLKQGREEKSNR